MGAQGTGDRKLEVPLSFTDVFRRELDVINYRRQAMEDGTVANLRRGGVERRAQGTENTGAVAEPASLFALPRAELGLKWDNADAEKRGTNETTGEDLTGIALSGGGIRSASFSLGVLQALDSLSDHDEPHVLDAVDYLSTVSGGGYIGTSLVAALVQPDYSFPFDSRLGEQETCETQHVRDYSNFLAPNGLIDYVVTAGLVLRGLLVNAIVILPALLVLAAITIASNPVVKDLKEADFFGIVPNGSILPDAIKDLDPFTFTVLCVFLAVLVMFVSAIVGSFVYRISTLRKREIFGYTLAWMLVVVAAAILCEIQPFVLSGLASASTTARPLDLPAGPADDVLLTFGIILPSLATVLVPTAAILIAVAQKLANLVKASLGDAKWTTVLKKQASRILLFVAAVIVPLLLWITYLYLTLWGIRPEMGDTCGVATPGWLRALSSCDVSPTLSVAPRLGAVGTTYLYAALILGLACLLLGPNSNSLHTLYRDRLSRAFLFKRQHPDPQGAAGAADTRKFSSLKPFDGKIWSPSAALSPYLIVNTAINLQGSETLNRRGRNADTFIFSPLHIGSRPTGYVATKEMERVVPELGLASAMAISGAAASANMGRHTIKVLTFSLSLLNIRLGYWLPNPKRLAAFRHWFHRRTANIGTWFFAIETIGRLGEKTRNVYLTDGGHIENLGIYELLRRHCKVIIAVDAEVDPNMTFSALVTLQVMARIDLGITIDLSWDSVRQNALGATSTTPDGPSARVSRGPHGGIGIIKYNDKERGVLIYLKSSLTGDEGDSVLDYKRRYPAFPHETTVDQFFSEEQFEAYRALGFHATRGLLTGVDDFAKPYSVDKNWKAEVTAALKLLNVSSAKVAAIVTHI